MSETIAKSIDGIRGNMARGKLPQPGEKNNYDKLEMNSYQLLKNIAWAGQTISSMELVWTGQQLPAISKCSLSCFSSRAAQYCIWGNHNYI